MRSKAAGPHRRCRAFGHRRPVPGSGDRRPPIHGSTSSKPAPSKPTTTVGRSVMYAVSRRVNTYLLESRPCQGPRSTTGSRPGCRRTRTDSSDGRGRDIGDRGVAARSRRPVAPPTNALGCPDTKDAPGACRIRAAGRQDRWWPAGPPVVIDPSSSPSVFEDRPIRVDSGRSGRGGSVMPDRGPPPSHRYWTAMGSRVASGRSGRP